MARSMSQMTLREALNSAMDEEMARDDSVFLMGTVLEPCMRYCPWLITA